MALTVLCWNTLSWNCLFSLSFYHSQDICSCLSVIGTKHGQGGKKDHFSYSQSFLFSVFLLASHSSQRTMWRCVFVQLLVCLSSVPLVGSIQSPISAVARILPAFMCWEGMENYWSKWNCYQLLPELLRFHSLLYCGEDT